MQFQTPSNSTNQYILYSQVVKFAFQKEHNYVLEVFAYINQNE